MSGVFAAPPKNLYIGIGYVFCTKFQLYNNIKSMSILRYRFYLSGRQQESDTDSPCPCLMKTDMEESENIYDFLKDYFWEIESEKDWRKLSLSNLKCSRCLLCAALKLVKEKEKEEIEKYKVAKDKYGKENVARLATAKSIVSKRYFKYKLLKWFMWMKKS